MIELVIITACVFILSFALCGAMSQSIGVGLLGGILLTYLFSTWWNNNITSPPVKMKDGVRNKLSNTSNDDTELIMRLEKEFGNNTKIIIISK